jgi:hypothetical protein
MKLAIMQPYVFPYLGYFQLAAAVDKFIFLDDVNYIKKGFINRNNILQLDKPCRFSLAIANVSQNRLINQHVIVDDFSHFLKMLRGSYSRAPYFSAVYPVIERLCLTADKNIACFARQTVCGIFAYLHRAFDSVFSSEFNTSDLKAQQKIIGLCQAVNATEYINPLGGAALYQADVFAQHGIKLRFLQPGIESYHQFKPGFVASLSIIDVLMFNSAAEVCRMLNMGKLLDAGEL